MFSTQNFKGSKSTNNIHTIRPRTGRWVLRIYKLDYMNDRQTKKWINTEEHHYKALYTSWWLTNSHFYGSRNSPSHPQKPSTAPAQSQFNSVHTITPSISKTPMLCFPPYYILVSGISSSSEELQWKFWTHFAYCITNISHSKQI